jgi:hypothetical protein
MFANRLLVGLIAAAVLVAGYFFVPRSEEQVAMLTRDGQYEMAAQELTSIQAGSDKPRAFMQAQLLKEMRGDAAGALEELDGFLANRPRDITARRRQAELLLQTGQVGRYLEALATLARAQPSQLSIAHLQALYRLHGRFDDELALLRGHAGGRYMVAAQWERLGALLAERGEWVEARRWLKLADQTMPPEASEGRLQLLDVLIENNDLAAIAALSPKWLRNWHSPYLSGRLILRLAQAGLDAQAGDLARAATKQMPGQAFAISGVLTQKGQAWIARQMLAHWAQLVTEPTDEELRGFIHASVKAGDPAAPFTKLAHLARSRAPAIVQARFAEELAHAFGTHALAPLREMLTADVLLARPLFAAQLALFEGNAQLARWYADQIHPAQIDRQQHQAWLSLLHRTHTPDAVVDRLHHLWRGKQLPPDLMRTFAQEARNTGRHGLHDAIWASLNR